MTEEERGMCGLKCEREMTTLSCLLIDSVKECSNSSITG